MVLGDAVEPGREGLVGGKLTDALEGGEKSLLSEIRGEVRVAGLAREAPEQERMMAVD